jgi:hypothetical protein
MKTEAFQQGIALLSEAFPKREINPKLFYDALKDLKDDEFKSAILSIVQTTTKLYPDDNLIAMIREKVTGSQDDRSVLAWAEARNAIITIGLYQTVSFSDLVINGVISAMGGWEKFCSMLIEEEPFRQKDFISLYKAISSSGRKCPDCLIGHFERINGVAERVILIGQSTNKKMIVENKQDKALDRVS